MLTDKLLTLSDAQAVTTTAISANVIDLGPLGGGNLIRDIGAGSPMDLVITVTEAVTAAGAATDTITLESDSTADLATSPTVHWSSGAVPKATMVAGYQFPPIPLPPGNYERYLGLRHTIGTGPLTAGKFTATIVKRADSRRDYASGFTTGV